VCSEIVVQVKIKAQNADEKQCPSCEEHVMLVQMMLVRVPIDSKMLVN